MAGGISDPSPIIARSLPGLSIKQNYSCAAHLQNTNVVYSHQKVKINPNNQMINLAQLGGWMLLSWRCLLHTAMMHSLTNDRDNIDATKILPDLRKYSRI